MALHYSLLFSYGEQGFHVGVLLWDDSEKRR
jgi:hypothetical protein